MFEYKHASLFLFRRGKKGFITLTEGEEERGEEQVNRDAASREGRRDQEDASHAAADAGQASSHGHRHPSLTVNLRADCRHCAVTVTVISLCYKHK